MLFRILTQRSKKPRNQIKDRKVICYFVNYSSQGYVIETNTLSDELQKWVLFSLKWIETTILVGCLFIWILHGVSQLLARAINKQGHARNFLWDRGLWQSPKKYLCRHELDNLLLRLIKDISIYLHMFALISRCTFWILELVDWGKKKGNFLKSNQ